MDDICCVVCELFGCRVANFQMIWSYRFISIEYISARCFQNVSAPLISSIKKPTYADAEQVHCAQMELKAEVHHSNQQKISSCANEVRSSLPQNLQNEQSCESGASSWLTVIPMTEFCFKTCANRRSVTLYVCVMDGPSAVFHLPSCVCGMPFSIDHWPCIQLPKACVPHHQTEQDQIPTSRVAHWSLPLCHSGESFQHHTTNTEDNARLDVCAREVWDKSKATFFGPSNGSLSTTACYHKHEMEKRRKYERRILRLSMEHSLHLLCPQVEKWGLLLQSPSRGCHHSWQRSPTSPIRWWWMWSDAGRPFISLTPQSCASGEQDHILQKTSYSVWFSCSDCSGNRVGPTINNRTLETYHA